MSYRALWESGQLQAVARECKTMVELARRLGVSENALDCGLRRLREDGLAVPTGPELLGVQRGPRLEAVPMPVEEGDRTQEFEMPAFGDAEPALDPVDEHRLQRKLRELEADKKAALERISRLQDHLADIRQACEYRVAPIVPRERTSGLREGTAVFLVSDLHLEEEVKPEKVSGRNRFNLDIASRRMTRLAEGMRWFIDAQRQDFEIRDVCLWIGGDTFTGYLHDDNIESNQLAPPAAFAFAKQRLSDNINHLLQDERIERLVLPCNDGNHSRLTKELRAASRAELSLETVMYAMLAEEFRHDPRVQFEIAQGDHLYTQIYDLTVRWTHGAEVRGGSGIGGIMMPIYRAMSRWETVRHADLTCMAHFHQRISLRDLEVNSSLIGFSPYAVRIGARYEEPSQSAFMIDSKRGKSVSAPIWVADRDEEERWAS